MLLKQGCDRSGVAKFVKKWSNPAIAIFLSKFIIFSIKLDTFPAEIRSSN